METMRAVDQLKQPDCTLGALEAGAVKGWITAYPLAGQTGSTAVLLRDGDMLTIRSLSADAALALSNAEALVAKVVPLIVGD